MSSISPSILCRKYKKKVFFSNPLIRLVFVKLTALIQQIDPNYRHIYSPKKIDNFCNAIKTNHGKGRLGKGEEEGSLRAVGSVKSP